MAKCKLYERTLKVIVLLLITSVVVSGCTFLAYVRVPRIWLTGILSFFLLITGMSKCYLKNIHIKQYTIWLVYLIVNLLNSYTFGLSLKALTVFVAIFFIIIISFSFEELGSLFELIRVVCIVYAFSIILNAIIPRLFLEQLSFLSFQSPNAILAEIQSGAFSGLVGDRALAAYFMNVAIIIEFALMNLKQNKVVSIFFLSAYYAALLLTGKRTLFVISLITLLCYFYFSNINNKIAKFLMFCILGLPILVILVTEVPQLQVVFARFVENSGDSTLNGRTVFWDFCLVMFSEHPLFGYGFDSFNTYFGEVVHLIYNGSLWNMYAHNIYVEMLGELGIIGVTIFTFGALLLLLDTLKCLKISTLDGKQRAYLQIALNLQLLFLIYGFTGNCLYEHEQLLLYYLSIPILLSVKNSILLEKSYKIAFYY